MDTPFDIAVYTKNLDRPGWVGAPEVVSVSPRHNQQSTASITVPAGHAINAALLADGARVIVRYRDEYTVGGTVGLRSSKGAGATRTLTYQVSDDWQILADMLGWPVPGSALSAQSGAEYDVRTGPAETVVKGYLTANLARLSDAFAAPVTIAPDLGRGATITSRARMVPLADALFPLVDQAGIGVQVQQTLTGLEVDCYEPVDWPLRLSEDGGTLISNDWELRPPTVTRVVLGVDGEGTGRTFDGPYIDTVAEAAIGRPIERFVDARDLDHTAVGYTTLAQARADEALAAGAAAAGLSIELAETEVFRYGGEGIHVGDRVVVEIAPANDTDPAVLITDVLRSATLTWTARGGPVVTPVVGERTNDPTALTMRALERMARRQRQQGV